MVSVHPHECGEDWSLSPEFSTLSSVHPHECGEDVSRSQSMIFSPSVHPHECGEDDYPNSVVRGGTRFTPTSVGKIKPKQPVQVTLSVHPHECGEDTSIIPELTWFETTTTRLCLFGLEMHSKPKVSLSFVQ